MQYTNTFASMSLQCFDVLIQREEEHPGRKKPAAAITESSPLEIRAILD